MKCPICDGMGTSNTCVNGTFKPCAFCDGTGEVMTDDIKIRCDDCKFVENCVDYGWEGCRKFTPIQNKPITNFQRITASEETLAEFISNITCECWGCKRVYSASCPHHKSGLTDFCDRENALEWLKEIHHDGSRGTQEER